jgi:hypothetical protein
VRLGLLLGLAPLEQQRLELANARLPIELRAQPLAMRAFQPPLVEEGELFVASLQPALLNPRFLGVHLDGKALRPALVFGALVALSKLAELRFELLLPAQEIDELRRRAETFDRFGGAFDRRPAGARASGDPERNAFRRFVVELLPGPVAAHQAFAFSIICRMRSSRIAGGGTGTSLVRIRLEPSALY